MYQEFVWNLVLGICLDFGTWVLEFNEEELTDELFFVLGWKMGLEPTTPGTTIQCSNQLSYIHRLWRCKDNQKLKIKKLKII